MMKKFLYYKKIWLVFLLMHLFFYGNVIASMNQLFPKPDIIKDNILFWKKIYTEVSLNEGLLHDRDYPMIIYKKISFENINAKTLEKYIDEEKKIICDSIEKIMFSSPRYWSQNEKKIIALYQKYASMNEISTASKRIRFQLGQQERFKKGLIRSGRYMHEIFSVLRKQNLPLRLAYLPHVESSFNCKAFSKSGAAGLWQFIPSTGRLYMTINNQVDERRDPKLSSIAAAKLLKRNYEILQSWPLAITAYNYGLAGIKRAVDQTNSRNISDIIQFYKSSSFQFASRNFYSCFLAVCDIDENYLDYFESIELDQPQVRKPIQLIKRITPDRLCSLLNININNFKELNPSLKPSFYSLNAAINSSQTIFLPAGVKTNAIANIIKFENNIAQDDSTKLYSNSIKFENNDLKEESTISYYSYFKKDYHKAETQASQVNEVQNSNVSLMESPGTFRSEKEFEDNIDIAENNSTNSLEFEDNENLKNNNPKNFLDIYNNAIIKTISGDNDQIKTYSIPAYETQHLKTQISGRLYQVQKGDTLDIISQKTNTSVNTITELNNLPINSQLYPGQQLILSKRHIVSNKNVEGNQDIESLNNNISNINNDLNNVDLEKNKYENQYNIEQNNDDNNSFKSSTQFSNTNYNTEKENFEDIEVKKAQIQKDRELIKQQNNKYYQVQRGDSLWLISKKTKVNEKLIAIANNISIKNPIYPGQVLVIPLNSKETNSYNQFSLKKDEKIKNDIIDVNDDQIDKKEIKEPLSNLHYVVKKGDSLWQIANKFNIETQEIKRLNKMKSKIIYPGQELIIPKSKKTDKLDAKEVVEKLIPEKIPSENIVDSEKNDKKIITILNKNKVGFKTEKIKYTIDYYYKVKKGENLSSIAEKTGVPVDRIAKVNNMRSNGNVYEGQVLRIPLKEKKDNNENNKNNENNETLNTNNTELASENSNS